MTGAAADAAKRRRGLEEELLYLAQLAGRVVLPLEPGLKVNLGAMGGSNGV